MRARLPRSRGHQPARARPHPAGTAPRREVAPRRPGPVNDGALSGGAPLPPDMRSYFEPRLGRDLGHVRLHTGRRAAMRADAIGARAYTLGHDVVFAAGEHAGTTVSRRLLAHELAHVAQSPAPGTIRRDARDDVTGTSISPDYARDLGDGALDELIAFLEDLATDQASSSTMYEVIENNLGVLRAEWMERQASPPARTEAVPPGPAETEKPYTVGDRDEHIPLPGYRGPLRPASQYTKPFAVDYARRGCYEAAELAENYMCPTCHVLTKVDPCEFNLRGYVDDYHRNYRIGQVMVGSVAFGAVFPEVAAVVGAFEAGVATGETVTGESSGIRPSNLVHGRFDPGRKLSTTERVLGGVEAALFWTGIGWEMRATRQAASTSVRESRNAYGIQGRATPAKQYRDPFSGHDYDVAARSGTPRSQRTAIDADRAEVDDYKQLLDSGEVGLAGTNGANRRGPDSITYNPDDGFIYVNDSQTFWTAQPSANKDATFSRAWENEARQAARQADFGNPKLEADIQAAAAANRIRRRNHAPRRVDPPASGSGPFIDIGGDL